jgi:hypothetical protein
MEAGRGKELHMPEREDEKADARPRRRLPRMSDLLDVTDDMIAFADKYQQVWENEAKATISLGEFLNFRAQSLRTQVDLMRMGTDAFNRYNAWSEAIFGVRPESFMRGLMDTVDRLRPQPREGAPT